MGTDVEPEDDAQESEGREMRFHVRALWLLPGA